MKQKLSLLVIVWTVTFCNVVVAADYHEYLKKAMNTLSKEDAYNAIPYLDLAMENANGSVEPYAIAAKLETMFALSNGQLVSDMIGLCEILKSANSLGGFDFPPQLGGGTSQDKQDLVCSFVDKGTGDEIFGWGVQILGRTGADNSSQKRALRYFEVAEQKGVKSLDLFKARGLIYFAQARYSEAANDLEKVVARSPDPFLLRLLGISQLMIAKNRSAIAKAKQILNKAAAQGDNRSVEVLSQIDTSITHNQAGLERESWGDSDLGISGQSYAYSCNGKVFTVNKSGNFLNTWGLSSNCLVSTTVHTDTVESAAKQSCDCFMAQ